MPLPSETRYTGTRYIELMRHRLGKTPASRHRLIDSFNEAGRSLFIAATGAPHFHDWSWTVAENFMVRLEAGREYLELPDDFGTLVSVQPESGITDSIHLTDPSDISARRSGFETSATDLWLAFAVGSTPIAVDVEGTTKKTASVYPVQESARMLRLNYTRVWIDFTDQDLDRVPNIPKEWDRLLRLQAQANAVETENGTEPFDLQPYSAELERLVAFDAARQVDQGPPRHSVMARAQGRSRGIQYPHRGITRP